MEIKKKWIWLNISVRNTKTTSERKNKGRVSRTFIRNMKILKVHRKNCWIILLERQMMMNKGRRSLRRWMTSRRSCTWWSFGEYATSRQWDQLCWNVSFISYTQESSTMAPPRTSNWSRSKFLSISWCLRTNSRGGRAWSCWFSWCMLQPMCLTTFASI